MCENASENVRCVCVSTCVCVQGVCICMCLYDSICLSIHIDVCLCMPILQVMKNWTVGRPGNEAPIPPLVLFMVLSLIWSVFQQT